MLHIGFAVLCYLITFQLYVRIATSDDSCPSEGYWTLCAAEGGSCAIPDFVREGFVSYGADGSYTLMPFTNAAGAATNIACGNDFGDVIPGTAKKCCYSLCRYHECPGSDQFCHTQDSLALTCDSGYVSSCNRPVDEICVDGCASQWNECSATDSTCEFRNGVFRCRDGYLTSCSEPLTADCNEECSLTAWHECPGSDTNCHTVNGVRLCDDDYGWFISCDEPLTGGCDSNCVRETTDTGYNECSASWDGDNYCHAVDGVLRCDDAFATSCSEPLSGDCGGECESIYHECTGTDNRCHTVDGVRRCDAGWEISCDEPLTEDCGKSCHQSGTWGECTATGVPLDTWQGNLAEGGGWALGASIKTQRYGANNQYVYRVLKKAPAWCVNSFFNDPIYGTAKHCQYNNDVPTTVSSATWTNCEQQEEECSGFDAHSFHWMRYGAGEQYYYRLVRSENGNTIPCKDGFFGDDPNQGTTKTCWISEALTFAEIAAQGWTVGMPEGYPPTEIKWRQLYVAEEWIGNNQLAACLFGVVSVMLMWWATKCIDKCKNTSRPKDKGEYKFSKVLDTDLESDATEY